MDHTDMVPRAHRARRALALFGPYFARLWLTAMPVLLTGTALVALGGCIGTVEAGAIDLDDPAAGDLPVDADPTAIAETTHDLDTALDDDADLGAVRPVYTVQTAPDGAGAGANESVDEAESEADDAGPRDDEPVDEAESTADDASLGEDAPSDDAATEPDGAGTGWGSPVIVVLGSSTAAGVGASSGWVERYRAYLRQTFPNFQLHNLSQGGATTYDIQPSDYTPPPNRAWPAGNRNITYALSLNPGAIIINMPTNDQQARFTVDEQMANYNRVASLAASRGVQVWVATPQPRNFPDVNQRNNLVATRNAIFGRFGNHTLDFWNGIAQGDGTIIRAYDSGDGVHLNDSGHQVLAERAQWARIPYAVLGQ